jgi:hypothetical protein
MHYVQYGLKGVAAVTICHIPLVQWKNYLILLDLKDRHEGSVSEMTQLGCSLCQPEPLLGESCLELSPLRFSPEFPLSTWNSQRHFRVFDPFVFIQFVGHVVPQQYSRETPWVPLAIPTRGAFLYSTVVIPGNFSAAAWEAKAGQAKYVYGFQPPRDDDTS